MSIAPPVHRSVASNVARGSAGNLIEWYDFYTYTIFASYFSEVFFPGRDVVASNLSAFGIFALAFVMRPVGSWLFGRIADRAGRRHSLVLSVLLMAVGSLIIACTPGYDSIGVAAGWILLFARLLQGLSVGGEYGTSSTYLSEVATPNHRGFYSSFQYSTLIGGQLSALIVQIILQQLLSEKDLTDWGWRIAFLIGAVGALAVLWLRRGMDESIPAGQLEAAKLATSDPAPGTLRLLARYWRTCLIVFGLTCGGSLAFYTFTTFTQNSMNTAKLLPRSDISLVMFCALALCLVLQPLAGALSDRIGRKPLLVWFGVTTVLFTWPLLWVISHTESTSTAFWMLALAMIMMTGYTSINAIVKAELFPSSIRALGLGLSYGLANALFGGTAVYVGNLFVWWKIPTGFYWYVIIIVLGSLLVVIFGLPNRKPSHLDRERGHAAHVHEEVE